MTDAPELKPCPFCGGKPYLANVEMVGCAYVVCTDCRTQSDDMTKERAIERWNTRADLAAAPEPLQSRVQPWMMACFGPEISADRLERGDRLLEEVLELLQSGNYPPERVSALVGYVWSRPVGDPPQEVGGVMITMAAYCLAHGLDMHKAGEDELARIWTKVEKIRAKQASKPMGSELPQSWPSDLAAAQVAEAVAKALGIMATGMDDVNRLRLAAFKSNKPDDTAAYHAAAAKWFQQHEFRVIDAVNATAFRDGDE